jgi:phospholipid/cholesterol/gamma-HCH transport system permease protein
MVGGRVVVRADWFVAAVGQNVLRRAQSPWEFIRFITVVFSRFFRQLSRGQFRFHDTVLQVYSVGVLSLPVVAFSLAFIALMMILEFSFHMKQVLRQDSLVPAFSTLLMLRELGPVVTCLLLTSRVGAGISAEIGTMRVTDQLDAMLLLSLDPIDYLVLPRWVACVLACIFLSVVSVAIAIVAGASIASVKLGYTVPEFFNTMFVFARLKDGTACLVKSAVFGTLLPLVASFHGLRCKPGSEGVGSAATNAVVHGSILIIIADFVVTYVLYTL